jgi:hypothetical protein
MSMMRRSHCDSCCRGASSGGPSCRLCALLSPAFWGSANLLNLRMTHRIGRHPRSLRGWRVNLANSREIHVAGAGIWQDVDSAQGIRPLVQVTNLGESQMYAFTT